MQLYYNRERTLRIKKENTKIKHTRANTEDSMFGQNGGGKFIMQHPHRASSFCSHYTSN